MRCIRRTNRLISLLLVFVLMACCAAGCRKDAGQNGEQTWSPPASTTSKPKEPPAVNPPVTTTTGPKETPSISPPVTDTPENPTTNSPEYTVAINLNFKPEFGRAGSAYSPVRIKPGVADYAVKADLSNIINLNQFPNLTAEQKMKLASNGFVVAPGKQEQLFYIYEDNTYKKIPNFVTTDSVLQVYHIFFDYALRSVEGITLLPNAVELNNNMLVQLQNVYSSVSDPAVKAEALKALSYFGVAQLAFGEKLPSDFPADALTLVQKEMILVNAADGIHKSAIFGYDIDYTLFTVRGHYTRSDELERFFRGMSWYGVIPYPLYKDGLGGKTPDYESAIRTIITVLALCSLPELSGVALWENIYSTTVFFVGVADDLTPFQIAEIVNRVYGSSPNLNMISDPSKLELFYEEARKLPKPQINAKSASGQKKGDIPSGLQFRFMGQRYIPDSEILQELSEPILRPFPAGLDVFASLGSKRAADIIATIYRPVEKWPDYNKRFEEMRAKFTSLPDSLWQSNMYYAWLWTQNSLTGEYGKGYPMFMRNTAWQDKSLSTALGSWAEMRHDTILYGKGSAAECGGFDDPPVVRAYVEPNVELYNRLLWLTSFSRENLLARGVLPENIEYTCERFEDMLVFLRDCSIKELRGEDLTAAEYDSLLTYGGLLEYLTASCVENAYKWYQITSETDRNMAVIADVHTSSGAFLEVGVGSAAEIYVVVPMGGDLYITRGAVFDYFEFVSQKRLTDEEWQAIVRAKTPERPPFVSSFQAGEAPEVPAPAKPYTTGC